MPTARRSPPVLGACPRCDTEIASFDVLIEYEHSNGRPAVWAACPSCGDVVHPE